MPYRCSADDDNPVVIHLQQLDDGYEQVDFCQEHWVQFIYSSAEALGMIGPEGEPTPERAATPDEEAAEPDQAASGDQEATDDQSAPTSDLGQWQVLDEDGQPIPY